MKKIKFIAMAMLALLTAQCKKNEPEPEPKVMVPISGSVSFGGGSKTEITTTGYVTPKSGDMIYIYHAGDYVGSLTCTPGTGQAFTCSGEIEQSCLGEACTFMYLGSENSVNGESTTISFADQTGISANSGKISGIDKFHVGSCKANVSDEGTVSLPMRTKISIAYFQLKDQNGSAMANKNITISGVSATATINKTNGTLEGVPGDITVHTDANGCFYMALVPQSGAANFTFTSANANGTDVFPYGIGECCFYSEQGNVSKPLPVQMNSIVTPDLLPGKFSVSPTVYVQFSMGNLLATRSSSSSDDWKLGFFENQYDYGTYSTGNVFTANDTEMSLFTFGFDTKATSFDPIGQATGSEDWGNEYNRQYSLPSGTWQTLTGGPYGEWWYLLDGRPNAANLKVFKTVHGISNCLIIFPDDFDLSDIPSSTELTDDQWSDLEAKGAVCLPRAGLRVLNTYGTSSNGYWANNSYGASNAYGVFFSGSTTVTSDGGGSSNYGYSVRLVQKFDWPEVEPTFVDLGLPSGTLWADVNVGAVSKTGVGSYGKFYAWGETAAYLEPMTGYGIWAGATNAKYVEGTIKQHVNNNYWKWLFPSGSTAKYKALDLMLPEDDIATLKYGDGCHIPTMAQWYELFDDEYCTWTWDATKNGYIVTSVKYPGRSIFIPQAGYYKESVNFTYDTQARFWSSDYWNSKSQNCVYINPNSGIRSGSGLSDYGNVLTIRAVKPKPIEYVEIAGLKWATENLAVSESGMQEWKGLNAEHPTGHIVGDYFQWAASYEGYNVDPATATPLDLLTYTEFSHKNCVSGATSKFTFKDGGNRFYTKCSTAGNYSVDAVLNPSDDPASVILGGGWRMPTNKELKDLVAATYCAWDATDCGCYVFEPQGTTYPKNKFVGAIPEGLDKKDALLFFPACGYGNSWESENALSSAGTTGYYSSSTCYVAGTGGNRMHFNSSTILPDGYGYGLYGFSIRPVHD